VRHPTCIFPAEIDQDILTSFSAFIPKARVPLWSTKCYVFHDYVVVYFVIVGSDDVAIQMGVGKELV
jgi:hypothetical protein